MIPTWVALVLVLAGVATGLFIGIIVLGGFRNLLGDMVAHVREYRAVRAEMLMIDQARAALNQEETRA